MSCSFPLKFHRYSGGRPDCIVVSTLRCGRNNPGSNPGYGTFLPELLKIGTLRKKLYLPVKIRKCEANCPHGNIKAGSHDPIFTQIQRSY